jgi:Mlc titration factor MtfA (ptsG expression regulator)
VPPVRLTNDVVVAVAAQACLPVLQLGLERYDGFVGIVLHPDQVVARREHVDEHGVVHEYDEELLRRGRRRRPGDAVVARRAQQRPRRRPKATTW